MTTKEHKKMNGNDKVVRGSTYTVFINKITLTKCILFGQTWDKIKSKLVIHIHASPLENKESKSCIITIGDK